MREVLSLFVGICFLIISLFIVTTPNTVEMYVFAGFLDLVGIVLVWYGCKSI